MDPLSQGVLGAALPQSTAKKKHKLSSIFMIGLLSGMAPDLDVLIRSTSDPLLFLEFHRQFTHSLIFIPVGALLCAGLLYSMYKDEMEFKWIYLYAILGYATHGLLDSCTTYGTQLFWPFSNYRVAWNNVGIVDPVFTLPLLVLTILAATRQKRIFGRVAMGWALFYLTLGVIQRERAESVGRKFLESRGLEIISMSAKPTVGNLVLWKIVSETEDHYFIDAVKVGLSSKVFPGGKLEKFKDSSQLDWIGKSPVQKNDIERFRWFSSGYLAKDPRRKNVLVDARYSMVPNEIESLWGIRLFPDYPERHVTYEIFRNPSKEKFRKILNMVFD